MRLKKGDTVYIRTGKDRGKSGKVLHIDVVGGRLTIDGLNLYKKHSRPKRQGEKGEIVTVPRSIAISNAMLYCSSCGKGVRTGIRIADGRKSRHCKSCDAVI